MISTCCNAPIQVRKIGTKKNILCSSCNSYCDVMTRKGMLNIPSPEKKESIKIKGKDNQYAQYDRSRRRRWNQE